MNMLRRLGIVAPYSVDDVLDAHVENALYEHTQAVEALKQADEDRKGADSKLREALLLAKVRNAPLADFELTIRGDD